MGEDGNRFRMAARGGHEREAIFAMVEAIKQAMAPYVTCSADPRDGIAFSITAASMFAGAQWGTLLHMGEVTQQETKRGAEMASRNFREGIKVGLAHARRVEVEEHGAGHA